MKRAITGSVLLGSLLLAMPVHAGRGKPPTASELAAYNRKYGKNSEYYKREQRKEKIREAKESPVAVIIIHK